MPSEDVVLIGAGRHPFTKQVREQAVMKLGGHIRRTFWVGPLHVRSGMRFHVDIDFVRQHFDQIVEAIEHGTLLIEYKYDKYVDPDELKELAFGGDDAYEAHQQKQKEGQDAEAERLQLASDRREQHELEARKGTVLDRSPAASPGETALPVREDVDEDPYEADPGEGELPNDSDTELDTELERANGPLDNLEGSHEEAIAATAPEADESLVSPERTAEIEAEQAEDDPLLEGSVEDGATDHARIQRATKAELLQMCSERGIDTSDMPSNKVLRHRLEGRG